jgi:hypothetical protein
MAKPAMIIDVLAGPKDEEEEDLPPEDDGEEAPAAGGHDALIRSIQAQLDELRRELRDIG